MDFYEVNLVMTMTNMQGKLLKFIAVWMLYLMLFHCHPHYYSSTLLRGGNPGHVVGAFSVHPVRHHVGQTYPRQFACTSSQQAFRSQSSPLLSRTSRAPSNDCSVHKSTTVLHALTPIQSQFITSCTVNAIPGLWLHFRKQQRSLTPAGLLHATLLGIGLWTFLGLPGWIMGVSYLVLGSMATKVKMMEKEKLGIAEKRGGARGPENVWGSAASAMVAAMCTYCFPQHLTKWKVAFVAALATKLADTFSSEFGKAYGKTTFLITTLRKVPRGTEGAISLEGSLAGIGGSVLLAMLASVLGLITTAYQFQVVIIAALIATTLESYIGAIFQNKITWLNNEVVNLIMTIIGACLAFVWG